MFFQLSEIQKINSSLSDLEKSKQSLNNLTLNAYSKNQKSVQQSLASIIKEIKQEIQACLSVLSQIQTEIEMNYFIPSFLKIQDLVYNQQQLPEWFPYVFEKQYQKQKKSFDALAKKMYKSCSLDKIKNSLELDIQSFKILIQRFQALSQKEKSALNIMNEAQSIKNKSNNAKIKFQNFCKMISNKMLQFLEQTIGKSLNFSNSINQIAQKSLKNYNPIANKTQNFNSFQNRIQNNNFKYTAPTFETNNIYQRTNRSMDFYGRSQQVLNLNQHKRYVPRHFNTTLYQFYS